MQTYPFGTHVAFGSYTKYLDGSASEPHGIEAVLSAWTSNTSCYKELQLNVGREEII